MAKKKTKTKKKKEKKVDEDKLAETIGNPGDPLVGHIKGLKVKDGKIEILFGDVKPTVNSAMELMEYWIMEKRVNIIIQEREPELPFEEDGGESDPSLPGVL